jgi:hypothetical protein
MKVKPTDPNACPRFPNDLKRKLKPEGEEVPDGDIYWTRRLLDGSAKLVTDEPTPAAAPSAPIPPLTTR